MSILGKQHGLRELDKLYRSLDAFRRDLDKTRPFDFLADALLDDVFDGLCDLLDTIRNAEETIEKAIERHQEKNEEHHG